MSLHQLIQSVLSTIQLLSLKLVNLLMIHLFNFDVLWTRPLSLVKTVHPIQAWEGLGQRPRPFREPRTTPCTIDRFLNKILSIGDRVAKNYEVFSFV